MQQRGFRIIRFPIGNIRFVRRQISIDVVDHTLEYHRETYGLSLYRSPYYEEVREAYNSRYWASREFFRPLRIYYVYDDLSLQDFLYALTILGI